MLSMRNKLQHLLNAILILAMALAAMGTSVAFASETASVPSGAPAEPVDACSPTGAETVVTDQADYAPEETVHITGAGYAASCSVTVRITRPDGSVVVGDGSFAPGSDVVTTSPAGDLAYDYILNGIAGTYLIEVVGAAGQVLATTSFTDGTIRVYATGLGFAVYDILYTQRTDCTGPGQSHVGRGLGPNAFTSYTASATQSLKLIATYTSNSGIPFSHWSSDGSPFTNLGVFPYVNIAGFAICVPGFAGTGVRNYYAHFAAAPPPPPPPADTTPPTVTAGSSPAANANGWNNSDVTVTASGTDSGSGIASCTTVVVSTEGAGQSATVSCTDNAGNSSSTTVGGINIDKTVPTIVAEAMSAPNAANWYNSNVTVHFTCTDTLSGVPVGACPADQVLSTEGAGVASIAQTVMDVAGNTSASSNVVTVNIDKTAPTLNPIVSPNPVPLYGAATVTSGATDALSGLAAQSCGALDTSTAGSKSVTCTATDNAGNTNSASASYAVLTPAEQINNLTTTINGFNLSPAGIANSFNSKLQAATQALGANNTNAACGNMNAFINEVNAQSGKKLTTAQAGQLLASANQIKTSIGCP